MNITYLVVVGILTLIALNIAVYGHYKDIENFKMSGWMITGILILLLGAIGLAAPIGENTYSIIKEKTIFSDSSKAIYVFNDSVSLISTEAEVVHNPQLYDVRATLYHNALGLRIEPIKYVLIRKKI